MSAARLTDFARGCVDQSDAGHWGSFRPGRSLVLKLTVLVAVVVALLLAVLLLSGFYFWREILREQIDTRLSAVAESRRDFVREWVGRQQDRVQVYASRGVLRGWVERYVDNRREEVQRVQAQGNLDRHVESGSALGARITDAKGRVLMSSDPAEVGRDLSTDPVFLATVERPSIGLPRRVGNRFTILTGAPIQRLDGNRETVGVVLLTLDATPLADALRATTGLGQTGDVLLGVREGEYMRFLLAPRYRREGLDSRIAEVPAMAAATEDRSFLGLSRDSRGEAVLAAGKPVGYGGWGLVAQMDAREAYVPVTRAARHALLLGAIVGLSGLLAALLLARSFTRPVRGLVAAAGRVAAGDYEATVQVEGDDEVSVLAARFNTMIAAIRAHRTEREAHEAQVRESHEWLRLAQKAAQAGTWEWNLRTNENIWSDELWSLYGLAPNSCQPSFSAWIHTIVAEDRPEVLRRVKAASEAGSEMTAEWRVHYRDGSERWLFSRGQPQRDASGQVFRYLGIVLDITARKQAEAALRELNEQLEARIADRTAELRETVAELERFSYSVSHDMRAPLRTMEGYAKALLEDYGNKLGPEAQGYLQRIVAAASRQDRLICDVLSYSKVVRGQFTVEPVDVDRLVRELFQHYPNLRENAAAIEVRSPLGCVLGHEVLLTQCLSNLLSNALKFMPPGRPPQIVVRSDHKDGFVWLWVEDNGIGIAPEHHATIFGMLERVHSQREYEGTGIGLAIVRKAVERLGGEVGVISAMGHGSRFWLRLRIAFADGHGSAGVGCPPLIELHPAFHDSFIASRAGSGRCDARGGGTAEPCRIPG